MKPKLLVALSTVWAWLVILVLVTSLAAIPEESDAAQKTEEAKKKAPVATAEPPAVEGTLVIEKETEGEFEGSLGAAGSLITFDSEQVEEPGQGAEDQSPGQSPPDKIETSLEVNGKRIDVTEDLREETVRLDGHDNALFTEDKGALTALSGELDKKFVPSLKEASKRAKEKEPQGSSEKEPNPREDPENPLNPEEASLYAAATFLAEAPVGQPLSVLETSEPEPPKPAASDQSDVSPLKQPETTSAALLTRRPTSSKPIAIAATKPSEEKCSEAKELKDIRLVAQYCTRSDPDSHKNGEPYWFDCTTRYRWNQHDFFGLHCMLNMNDWSGPHSSSCTGRCGPTCGSNGYGVYTLDCLDHDICVRYHDYFGSACQDEFREAIDDYFWGDRWPGYLRACWW